MTNIRESKLLAKKKHSKKAIVLLSAIIFCVALYTYSAFKTTENAFKKTAVTKEIGTVSSSIGELESEYLNLKNSINLKTAYGRGFQDVKNPRYLSRQTLGKVTSRNEI